MFRLSLVCTMALALAGNAAAGWADSLFEERSHDFGSVPRGPTLTHSFRLTNNTEATLHISGVRVSCGCVSATALQSELAPGQSTTVYAQMDSGRFSGVKSVTIYVQLDRPQWDEVHLVVQANSRDDVSIQPEGLAFGQIKRGKPAAAGVTVSLLGSDELRVLSVRTESNYVQPACKEIRRANGEVAYQLTARLRPDVPVGKWYTDLWVRTNNPAAPQIRVPLTVEVEPPLSVSPAIAALGTVKEGETTERKILVRGERPFRITAVKGGDDQLRVRDLTEESKPLHVLLVTLKAGKAGERRWDLQVLTDLKEDGDVRFPAHAQIIP